MSVSRHNQEIRSSAFDQESIVIKKQYFVDPWLFGFFASDVVDVDPNVFRVAAMFGAGMRRPGSRDAPDVGLEAGRAGRRDQLRWRIIRPRPFDADDAIAAAECLSGSFDEELFDVAEIGERKPEALRVAQ